MRVVVLVGYVPGAYVLLVRTDVTNCSVAAVLMYKHFGVLIPYPGQAGFSTLCYWDSMESHAHVFS